MEALYSVYPKLVISKASNIANTHNFRWNTPYTRFLNFQKKPLYAVYLQTPADPENWNPAWPLCGVLEQNTLPDLRRSSEV